MGAIPLVVVVADSSVSGITASAQRSTVANRIPNMRTDLPVGGKIRKYIKLQSPKGKEDSKDAGMRRIPSALSRCNRGTCI
jgi:hypothetical protein